MSNCAYCGQEIPAESQFCRYCGAQVGGAPNQPAQGPPQYQQYQPVYAIPPKNTGVAVILALIGGLFGFMGIGHLYIGKIGKGIALLILGFVLFAVSIAVVFLAFITISPGLWILIFLPWIIWLILLIYQTVDAYNLSNKYNAELQRTGRAPW